LSAASSHSLESIIPGLTKFKPLKKSDETTNCSIHAWCARFLPAVVALQIAWLAVVAEASFSAVPLW